MSANIETWYDFVLQQMAAESYLDKAGQFRDGYQSVLLLGSNNPGYLQSGKLPQPTDPILSGATRMTATQATDFLARYTVVDHRSNDDPRFAALGANVAGVNVQIGNGSGLSATLMEKLDANGNGTGEFTLSVRSTEYADVAKGGDWNRDGYPGADGELGAPGKGFAFAQITALEEYYQTLKASGVLPVNATLNVTGYSLGGHVASVFAELHPTIVDGTITQAYVFNAPGHGSYDTTQLKGSASHYFRSYHATSPMH